ncbi:MAG TPA: hypothetical protein VNU71_13575 [Burkholderiaceae bacterium]|nr:hypothetical protein [Burkholderiaceae bacterium]
MTDAERFPLGVPTNRPPPSGPKPIPGRPNWVMENGKPHYVEPMRPPKNEGSVP